MKLQALGRRFLQIIIVLFGVSFLTFSLTYLAPGDPVRTMYAVIFALSLPPGGRW